jgi:hypothetical protein
MKRDDKMKEVVQKPVYKYICDICKTEIHNPELVTLNYEVHCGNGWNDWAEHREKHAHKRCLKALKFD